MNININLSLPILICCILLVFFIVCKVFNIITWGWGLVLIPLWILLGMYGFVIVTFIIIKKILD